MLINFLWQYKFIEDCSSTRQYINLLLVFKINIWLFADYISLSPWFLKSDVFLLGPSNFYTFWFSQLRHEIKPLNVIIKLVIAWNLSFNRCLLIFTNYFDKFFPAWWCWCRAFSAHIMLRSHTLIDASLTINYDELRPNRCVNLATYYII